MRIPAMLAAGLGLLLLATPATADRVVVISPKAKGSAKRAASVAVQSMVQTLQSKGVSVLALSGAKAGRLYARCLKTRRCVRRLGRRLKADYLVLGKASHRRRRYRVAWSLIDTAKGKVVRRSSARGRKISVIRHGARRGIRSLLRGRVALVSTSITGRTPAVEILRPGSSSQTAIASVQVADTEEPPQR